MNYLIIYKICFWILIVCYCCLWIRDKYKVYLIFIIKPFFANELLVLDTKNLSDDKLKNISIDNNDLQYGPTTKIEHMDSILICSVRAFSVRQAKETFIKMVPTIDERIIVAIDAKCMKYQLNIN